MYHPNAMKIVRKLACNGSHRVNFRINQWEELYAKSMSSLELSWNWVSETTKFIMIEEFSQGMQVLPFTMCPKRIRRHAQLFLSKLLAGPGNCRDLVCSAPDILDASGGECRSSAEKAPVDANSGLLSFQILTFQAQDALAKRLWSWRFVHVTWHVSSNTVGAVPMPSAS